MNLKKLTRGILAIGVAFAIVLVPNTAKFANAANTPSVEVNNELTLRGYGNYVDSKHFWTEKDDHTGTKTKVQVTVTNHSSKVVWFVIQEDVKGYGDNWHWNGSSWSGNTSANPFILAPKQTETFTVTTNTDQGLIKGHVRGVYVSASGAAGGASSLVADNDTRVSISGVDVNMKKVD
ncbi:MAG: hypothetical protein LBI63_00945 [Candidatus Ancillula sp.]|jgi:hypothetical protein|nr:hypothetical protein [Candidatus Ancillula sp.]